MKVQNLPLDLEPVRQMHQLCLAAFGYNLVSDVPDDVLYGEENRWNRTNCKQLVEDFQVLKVSRYFLAP